MTHYQTTLQTMQSRGLVSNADTATFLRCARERLAHLEAMGRPAAIVEAQRAVVARLEARARVEADYRLHLDPSEYDDAALLAALEEVR